MCVCVRVCLVAFCPLCINLSQLSLDQSCLRLCTYPYCSFVHFLKKSKITQVHLSFCTYCLLWGKSETRVAYFFDRLDCVF